MTTQTIAPDGTTQTPDTSIRRRHVLYIPGFDPMPPRRYRELYRREGAAQARIAGYGLTMRASRATSGYGWGVMGVFSGENNAAHRVETDMEVLVWSDVVAANMNRSIPATYGQLVRTAWAYAGSGALWRLLRLRRGPVIAALYPVAMLILQAAVALMVAVDLLWLLPLWAGLPLGVLAFGAILVWFRRIDNRFFAYYLMHDYAFTAQSRGAYPPELEARIGAFVQRLAAVLQDDSLDEVLLVGHSSGAYLAVSVLADLVRQAQAAGRRPDPRLALLTLGHVVPMAAFLPKARRLRGDLHDVSASTITWVDISAPGDACCFGLCDPVSTCGADPDQRNGPLVLSAAFNQTLSPERLKKLRGRWFRLHFQYLCAFDRPEHYDYFAITAGPLPLGARFAHRAHSPGRITRAVAPYQDREENR